MPSFDVVNVVDLQEVTNTVNNASKEIVQRYDFRGSNTQIEWDSKAGHIVVRTEDEMKMDAIQDLLAWLLTNPAVTSVIAGATKPEQVTANAKTVGWKLSEEEMGEIDGILKSGEANAE